MTSEAREGNVPMKSEERERMYQLCALIETEKDHKRFLKLINELNELLDRKEQRLEDKEDKEDKKTNRRPDESSPVFPSRLHPGARTRATQKKGPDIGLRGAADGFALC